MQLGVGIVGLPSVGKWTLFNALLKKQQALVANYPFATIEPNVGVVPVPDARLAEGASTGAWLGNKFLAHIREVDAMAHVVRAFRNADVVKEGSVDPKSDF